MSFSVLLTPDLVEVEPGATIPVGVTVTNKSDLADRFELEIEGIDSEWKAVPVPVISVDAGEVHTEKFFFKPPRTSESRAGNYPFVVRLRSLESGEQKTIQGVLQVNPYHHLSLEITPKKGFVSPSRKQNTFDLSIVNLGNTDHTVQLHGNDPEEYCAFEFEQEQITVGPGQQREIEITANPANSPIFSSGRLIGFSITARSIETPTVVASTQAQLEQRSLLSPSTVAVATLLALILLGWFFMMPKAPGLSLSVDPHQLTEGEAITVKWIAHDAGNVSIRAGNDVIYEGADISGTKEFHPTGAGPITIHAVATKDGRTGPEEITSIDVKAKTTAAEPTVLQFDASPKRVKLGNPFLLTYRFGDSVTKAILSPTNQALDPAIEKLYITPSVVGITEYNVIVYNTDGKTKRSRALRVEAFEESDATILDFSSSSLKVKPQDGKVTISWQVTNAQLLKLQATPGNVVALPQMQGSMDIPITAKTTFTLMAFDSKNRKATKSIIVEVDAIPIVDGGSAGGISPNVTPPPGDSVPGTTVPGTATPAPGGPR